jgi:serine/threonine protein kinase
MRPPSSLPLPDTAPELLLSLRAARLLSARRARVLARRWDARPEPGGCEARIRELLAAGVLTRYQAGQVLAGRARRLRLGPYRVLDRLGVGGMGQVYKAEHILMRRIVALKIVARLPWTEKGHVTPAPGGEPSRRELVARFRRETRAAARMSHANLVTAYDAGVARGFLFLVMEYVEGIDLGRFVSEKGPLPVPLACEAIRQAALALQYAHDRGIVHRDIKPDNLLLTWPGPATPSSVGSLPSMPDGTSGEGAALIKLLDLGLALPTRLPAGRVEPAGTPDFIAPEQAQGREPLDGRSDLYSLGCTFYYLLTGRVPYPGGTCAEKLLRHGLDVPSAVGDIRPEVPRAVAAIVERLMAKNPEQRYPGPAAVASVLWGLAEQGWNLGAPPPERPVMTTALEGLPALGAEGGQGANLNLTVNETPSAPSLPELPLLQAAVIPPRRRRLPAPRAVVAAVLAGPLLALAARGLPSSAPLGAEETPIARSALPFRVERLGREFVTLTEAITAAADGDVIIVHGAGPHRLPPTDLGSKGLTLRATGGERPRLEPMNPADDVAWQALLTTSRSLTLEGIDSATSGDAPLVVGTDAMLRLTDCRLAATGGGPAVVARGGEMRLISCRVRAVATALAALADASPCTVDLAGNIIAVSNPTGVAVAVWAPEAARPSDVILRLERNVVQSGRIASFRALPGRLFVEANANDFTFREALASFAGYADNAGWRRSTTWNGRDNCCHTAGSWLCVDGQRLAINDAAGWQRLWDDAPAAGPRQEATGRPAGLR